MQDASSGTQVGQRRANLDAFDEEARARLLAIAALPDDQINLSDPDAPEVVDWTGAVRGMFYKAERKGA